MPAPSDPTTGMVIRYNGKISPERLRALQWFPRGLTRREVALVLGVSRERVAQIEQNALRKIRDTLKRSMDEEAYDQLRGHAPSSP